MEGCPGNRRLTNLAFIDEYNNDGTNKFSSPTGYGSFEAEQQVKNVIKPMNDSRNAYASLFSSRNSPWSATPSAPSTAAKSNPFSLVKLSKDPTGAYDKANSDYLSNISSAHPDYAKVRGQIQSFLDSNNDNLASDQSAVRADTDSLISKFRGAQPNMDAETSAQTGQLNRYYLDENDPNSIASLLAGKNKSLTAAESRASSRAAAMAGLQARLAGAGGNSSYTNAQLMDTNRRIAENAAIRSGERSRADTSYVLDAQGRYAGKPQELETANVLRSNIPIEARNALIDQQSRQIAGRMANAGQAVNIDQLTDPLAIQGRKLGLTGQALQQYLAGNFLGVEKQGVDTNLNIPSYIPRYASHSPIGNFNSGGGYEPSGYAPSEPINRLVGSTPFQNRSWDRWNGGARSRPDSMVGPNGTVNGDYRTPGDLQPGPDLPLDYRDYDLRFGQAFSGNPNYDWAETNRLRSYYD